MFTVNPFILNTSKISGPKRSVKITDRFTCTSANVIYCITCTLCNKLYIKSNEGWSSQLWTQFMQLRKEAWKKIRASTGFEPVTPRYRCDALTNWAMKPLTLGAGQLWVPVKEMNVNDVYEINHIWTADMKSNEGWSSQLWMQFMQLRKEAWKKIRASTGFEPVTPRYRCDALTNWAMKPLTLGAGQLWVHMFPWKRWM